MKENNRPHISKRGRSFLENPTHVKSSEQNLKKMSWSWEIECVDVHAPLKSDKILTVQYSNFSMDEIESLFLVTLAGLSGKKSGEFLEKFKYREMENYLRDENHRPAFAEIGEEILISSFKKVKNSLLAALFFKKISTKKNFTGLKNHWEELSLVEKNRAISEILVELNTLFSEGKTLKLILAETETITLSSPESFLDLDVIAGVFQLIFRGEDVKTSFKVVAAL